MDRDELRRVIPLVWLFLDEDLNVGTRQHRANFAVDRHNCFAGAEFSRFGLVGVRFHAVTIAQNAGDANYKRRPGLYARNRAKKLGFLQSIALRGLRRGQQLVRAGPDWSG